VQDVITGVPPATGTFDVVVTDKSTRRSVGPTPLVLVSPGQSGPFTVRFPEQTTYNIDVKYVPPVGASGWGLGMEGNTDIRVVAAPGP